MHIIKRFSFWIVIISSFILIYNILGYDDKNLYLGLSNPILSFKLVYIDALREFLWDEITDKPTILYYTLYLLINFILGVIIDRIIVFKNKLLNKNSN